MSERLWHPSLDALIPEARRANRDIARYSEQAPAFDTPEGLAEVRSSNIFGGGTLERAEEREIPGRAGAIPVRVVRPDGPVAGVVVHAHGGGWCFGSAGSADQTMWDLARAARVATVSVDYRLAPEFPWPACADDLEDVALWLLEHAGDEFGSERLVFAGDSAGAHLAAVTLLRLRDTHDALGRVAGANLAFGVYDLGLTPSQRAAVDASVLSRQELETCYQYLLPGSTPEDRRDPTISPLYADLRDLCGVLLTVGTLDALLDDSLFLAARLRAAGVRCDLDIYPECVHGFIAFPFELARVATSRMHAWVADVLSPAGSVPNSARAQAQAVST